MADGVAKIRCHGCGARYQVLPGGHSLTLEIMDSGKQGVAEATSVFNQPNAISADPGAPGHGDDEAVESEEVGSHTTGELPGSGSMSSDAGNESATSGATEFDRDIPVGENIEVHGSVIFKRFVPDDVSVVVTGGGMRLEAGCGDRVKLVARLVDHGQARWADNSAHIQSIAGISVSIVDGNLIVDGNNASESQAPERLRDSLHGVTLMGPAGNELCIVTDGPVLLGDVGNGFKADADGSLRAGKIADSAQIDTGGAVQVGALGSDCRCDIGGALQCGDIGARNELDIGGSCMTGSIGKRTRIEAGGSIVAAAVAGKCELNAGGGITAMKVAKSTSLKAGGSTLIMSR